MRQALVLLVARVLLASLFLAFAVRGMLAFPVTAAYFAKLGFPVPIAFAVLSVAIQLVAGLMVALGWRARQAAWLLVAYVIIATAAAHRYWNTTPRCSLGRWGTSTRTWPSSAG